MKRRCVGLLLSLLSGLVASASVHATLMDGKAVEVFQYNPFFGQDVSFAGITTVGPGIEGFFPGLYNVDVTDTTVTVIFTTFSSFGDGGPDPFPTGMNGVRVLDVNSTISSFTSASLVSSTLLGFDLSRVGFDANNIYIDFENLNVATGNSVTVAVNAISAIPEPEQGVLLLTGLSALLFARRSDARRWLKYSKTKFPVGAV